MKQTAIEWLLEQLETKGDARETPSIRNIQFNIDTSDYLQLKAQAKAMEREQIEEAYKADLPHVNDLDAEQYYKETYGTASTTTNDL